LRAASSRSASVPSVLKLTLCCGLPSMRLDNSEIALTFASAGLVRHHLRSGNLTIALGQRPRCALTLAQRKLVEP
jgi:hypothetical protein